MVIPFEERVITWTYPSIFAILLLAIELHQFRLQILLPRICADVWLGSLKRIVELVLVTNQQGQTAF
jgi:hypothetical protein